VQQDTFHACSVCEIAKELGLYISTPEDAVDQGDVGGELRRANAAVSVYVRKAPRPSII
jgi:hypothetical protein